MNGASMPPPGRLRAGVLLSRVMSRCALEPRPPGKRWLVSAVGGGDAGVPGPYLQPASLARKIPQIPCLCFLI